MRALLALDGGVPVNIPRMLLLILLSTSVVVTSEGIDAALAFDWDRSSDDRIEEAVQMALFASADVRSGRIPNIHHAVLGDQCGKMAAAVVRYSLAHTDKPLTYEGLVICGNILSDEAKPGITRAVLSLLVAVRPANVREMTEGIRVVDALGIQRDPAVQKAISDWIQVTDDPEFLYHAALSGGENASRHVWDKLMAIPVGHWSPQQARLAYRLKPSDGARALLIANAVETVNAAKDGDLIESYAMAFQVLLRQSEFRNAMSPDIAAKLRQALIAEPGSLRQRLLLWLALLSDRDTAIQVVTAIGQTQARIWCTEAEWPKDGSDSRIPRDRIHDFVLLAMCPMPANPEWRRNLHAAILERATSRVDGLRFIKNGANRSALWSLSWRSASDGSAFVRSHTSLTSEFSSTSSPMVWALSASVYGRSYLGGTFGPMRSAAPSAELQQVVRRGDVNAGTLTAIRMLLMQYPSWVDTWRFVTPIWNGTEEDKLTVLSALCGALQKGLDSPAVWEFIRSQVVPELGVFPSGSIVQSLAVDAVSYTPYEPAIVDRIASLQMSDGWIWNPVVDALLTLDRRHPRVKSARDALAKEAYPSTPAVLAIFDAIAGQERVALPIDSWATILEHPQIGRVLDRMERHASILARSGFEFRDPRCLIGHMSAGLERPTERDSLDMAMRLLGVIDRIEAERQGCLPPSALRLNP